MSQIPQLPAVLIRPQVAAALEEDLGRAGDVTSLATLGPDMEADAVMASRDAGVICGMGFAAEAFALMEAGISFEPLVADGDAIAPGQEVARVRGNARAVLSAERVALNYLMQLSGIATETRRYAEEIAGTGARITCTRKTTPGLRMAQKYAVRCGGGANHRFGLDDAIMIKDNHIAVAGGIRGALDAARAYAGHMLPIEIEVDRLDQYREALEAGAKIILLDNMGPEGLREAVALRPEGVVLEASGGVDITTVRALAETGVDYISTSKITMAAGTLDIGLDIHLS
ncbi:carboxylating nicotinate-nucleotide diphosphorylase [Paracoccaceae bacterium GXU_MW_L88]